MNPVTLVLRRQRIAAAAAALLALAFAAGCGDSSPTQPEDVPLLESLQVMPGDSAQPGDELWILYSVFDTAGVTRSVLSFSGAFTQEIETNEHGVRTGNLGIRVPIPHEAQPGAALTVKLTIYNAKSHSASRTAPPIAIVDDVAPRVTGGPLALSGYVAGTAPEVAKGVGETLGLEIRATDNHQITWMGYRLGPPANVADSIAVNSANGAFDPRLVVPAAWLGTSSITLFARDAGGRLTEMVPSADHFQVYPVRSATPRTASLAELPTDYAYDARRDLLYLLLPNARSVAVFSVGTLTYDTPIVFDEAPAGIDLSLSADSLLVTLPEARALGVVAVAQTGRPVSRIPLDYDTTHARKPDRVRVAANGKAIVSLRAGDVTAGPRLIEYDLGTGLQHPRTELGLDGSAAAPTLLVHSWDRTQILAINGSPCCGGSGMVYVSARDVFTRSAGAEVAPGLPATADSVGRGYVNGGSYLTADLTSSRWIAPPDFHAYYYSPSALSPDGAHAYFVSGLGYKTVNVADGSMVEAVTLSTTSSDTSPMEQLYRFIALPGGDRLVGWTWNGDKLLVISPR